jgi:polyisoprenoid-binding protein YceI
MKKTMLLFAAMIGLSLQVSAKVETWVVDKAHSKVGFEIPHLVISTVEGKFTDFKGTIKFDPKNLKNTKDFSLNAEVNVATIDTENKKRDKHLRSKDFFDVKKYPKMTFKSTSFKVKGKELTIVGKLKIAKKEKTVTFKGKYLGTVTAYEIRRMVFKASTEISRKEFGLTWNDFVEAGPAVGDEVTIDLRVEAKSKKDLDDM